MKTQTKILPPELLLEEYRKLLQEEGVKELPLTITGSSMSPFLIHGRDTVYLSRLTRPARRGDMLLYRRDNGAYILHRVYAVTPESYTMVGDAQTELEYIPSPNQIHARVTAASHKGKPNRPGQLRWWAYRHLWLWLRPVRPMLMNLRELLRFRRK